MLCPKCHRRLHSATVFCPYDGTPLVRELEDDVDEEAGTTVYPGRDTPSGDPGAESRRAETVRMSRGRRRGQAPGAVDRRAETVRMPREKRRGQAPAQQPSSVDRAAQLAPGFGPEAAAPGDAWSPGEATQILPEEDGSGGEAAARRVPELPPGTRVGDYEITGILGHGGMATVYSARHPVIGKHVAVKVLRDPLGGGEDPLDRFVGEARAVNRIGSDRIVQIYGFGRLPDGRAYLVMDSVDGQSLDKLLKLGGALATTQAHSLFLDVASALAAAHAAGVVHRDVKPANIMVTLDDQSRFRARVVDFGVAKLLGSRLQVGVQTAQGVRIGTPTFMAPEQLRGEPADPRSDVYGFGVTLFQALTGELPFAAASGANVAILHMRAMPRIPSTLRQGLSREWDELILRCLEKDASHRPHSMVEVQRVLRQIGRSPSRGGTGYRTAVPWDSSLQPYESGDVTSGDRLSETEVIGHPSLRLAWWIGLSLVATLLVSLLLALLLR